MIEKVQVKYNGRFHEIEVSELDINPANATDGAVKTAVAQYIGADSLSEYVVEPAQNHADRAAATVLNLRPEASYGA